MGNLKAVIYGSGKSLRNADKNPEGCMRIVQNWAFKEIEPHIWIGMDEPQTFGIELMNTPYRKVFRGNYAGLKVNGIPAKEYPETYFIDVKPQDRKSVFKNKGLDCQFYWNKNTMQVAIHLALWMGFKHLAFSGIDLKGHYHDGRKLSPEKENEMKRLLNEEFEWLKWFWMCAVYSGIKLENMSKNSRLNEIIKEKRI
jgi:hypothetical protein